eukprot:4110428-Prymnesium_polylepis.1
MAVRVSTSRARSGPSSCRSGLYTSAHASELSSRPQTYSERTRERSDKQTTHGTGTLQEGSRMVASQTTEQMLQKTAPGLRTFAHARQLTWRESRRRARRK